MKINSKDVILNYLSVLMTLLSNLLILPFAMYFLTPELLGLWYVFTSIGTLLSLLDFGLTSTLSRSIAYSWGGSENLKKEGTTLSSNRSPNYLLLYKIVKAAKKIYFIISIIAFAILVTIGTIYIFWISRDLSFNSVIFGWIVFVIAVVLNLYFGYYPILLKGIGKITYFNIANIVSRIVQILVSIILLVLGFDLLSMTIAFLLNGIILRIICKKCFYSKEIILNFEDKSVNKNEIKEIFSAVAHTAKREGLISISNFFSSQATTLLCSGFLTLEQTGIYSITVQLIGACSSLATAINNLFQPKLQFLQVKKSIDKSRVLFGFIIFTYTIFFIFSSATIYFIGLPILSFIRGTIIINSGFFFVLAIYEYLFKFHSLHCSYISNANTIPYTKAFIVSSGLGLVLSAILLYFDFGIFALVVPPICVQLLYNNWKWPRVVYQSLNTNLTQMFSIGFKETIKIVKNRKLEF